MENVYVPEKQKMKTHRGFAVVCEKCGAPDKTFRALKFRGIKVYVCQDCLKDAMKRGIDIRTEFPQYEGGTQC